MPVPEFVFNCSGLLHRTRNSFAASENLLWRLPIKSIIQCRCVCKSWRSLITTPHFISTHLRNTKTKTHIFVHQQGKRTGSYSFVFDNDNQDYLRPISPYLPHPAPGTYSRILGSVNGLMCISVIAQSTGVHIVNLILFNPSIQHFLSIPPPHSYSLFGWYVTGFGFDERTQDYKILLIDSRDGFVYSSNSNCWRRLITPPVHFFWDSEVFVNGRIHLLAFHKTPVKSYTNSIILFDVKDETFGQISLPECLANSHDADITMMEFGESSIALIERTLRGVTLDKANDVDTTPFATAEIAHVEEDELELKRSKHVRSTKDIV
ncbi:F-box protein At3g07870-like [Euphorbia lathyris]|uniref:F-box protein At3g07870-like n=1 Tax=Euphorbia lathyris TaxID=212925 RepID=UPI00331328DC